MQVVIFAGGLGTRIAEETDFRPKPMINIGTKPILWHIMKIYYHHGFNDFIICAGYKKEFINDYFANFFQRNSDVTYNFSSNDPKISIHRPPSEKWKVTVVDTGLETQTAGRLAKVKNYITNDNFCLTYGDGVGNIKIDELIKFHKAHGRIASVTAVQPKGRFGSLEINGSVVDRFVEKPLGDGNWINGGFFVLKKNVFDYLPPNSDQIMWEEEPMLNLTQNNQLEAFKHTDFWHSMDTLRDKRFLDSLYKKNEAPWVIWEN